MPEKLLVDPAGRAFFTITEVAEARFLVNRLFQSKFGGEAPDFGRHFVAFYYGADGSLHVAGYSHMWMHQGCYLSGGSCSDGFILRSMNTGELAAVKAEGGVWAMVLRYAFATLDDHCEAYFGHCGNPRAREVALSTGFVATHTPYHIARWHRELSEARKAELLDEIIKIGLF
jgi:hypothetical protein